MNRPVVQWSLLAVAWLVTVGALTYLGLVAVFVLFSWPCCP
jgi:hypothetical protein